MKKSLLMVGSLLACSALLVGVGVFNNAKAPSLNAGDTSSLTLLLTNTNGLTSSDVNAGTYTWNTTTSGSYFVTWTGSGINYAANTFLHIAQSKGEFHNTITLHQITSITASGYESGSTTGTLLLYTSSTGYGDSDWSTSATTITNGVEAKLSATDNIGFVKFVYNGSGQTPANYVTRVSITYNCVA
jgi:hypothetical protein